MTARIVREVGDCLFFEGSEADLARALMQSEVRVQATNDPAIEWRIGLYAMRGPCSRPLACFRTFNAMWEFLMAHKWGVAEGFSIVLSRDPADRERVTYVDTASVSPTANPTGVTMAMPMQFRNNANSADVPLFVSGAASPPPTVQMNCGDAKSLKPMLYAEDRRQFIESLEDSRSARIYEELRKEGK